jgi:hypothetical protein
MATKEDSNVQTVLAAFDTLFNKRDYASAERFWSANYIQHSAHIPPGRDGLFGLIKTMAATLRYENHLAAATGDFVILHGRFSASARWRGSSPTSCAWKTACSPSTGTSSRMRPRGNSSRAACRCSAKNFRLDANPETLTFHRCCFAIAPATACLSRMQGGP